MIIYTDDELELQWELNARKRAEQAAIKKKSLMKKALESSDAAHLFIKLRRLTKNKPPIVFVGKKDPQPVQVYYVSKEKQELPKLRWVEIKKKNTTHFVPNRPTMRTIPDEMVLPWERWKDKRWMA